MFSHDFDDDNEAPLRNTILELNEELRKKEKTIRDLRGYIQIQTNQMVVDQKERDYWKNLCLKRPNTMDNTRNSIHLGSTGEYYQISIYDDDME
jgi:hypothetical protein